MDQDNRDVWCLTDEKQLESVALPQGNKMPCEALPKTIRAFMKRGLNIPKLGLAWWLMFNLDHVEEMKDLITVEQALDVGIRARVPQIFMILGEYLSQEQMESHRSTVMQWYQEATSDSASSSLKRTLPILTATLAEMKWIKSN